MKPTAAIAGMAARRGGPLRCVVVEDETMFLQLLIGLLRALPGIEVEATATTVASGIAACRKADVDLLIRDLALPDGDGLDMLRAVAAHRPGLRCIVLSSKADEFSCPQHLIGSIWAIVDKTQTCEMLELAVAGAVRSRQGLPPPAPDGRPEPRACLSGRELEVFELIGHGLTTLEIASRLGLSRHTVEAHRKAICGKLKARRAELMRWAMQHNRAAAAATEGRS
jgi:DNA-binding NarL/FixJ family response regulator